MSLILGFSVMYLRVKFYDFFLIVHIALSVITLVNLFKHTKIFGTEYDGFLWPCVAFWTFDRLCRIGRVAYYAATASSMKAPVEFDQESHILRVDVTSVFERTKPAGGEYFFL